MRAQAKVVVAHQVNALHPSLLVEALVIDAQEKENILTIRRDAAHNTQMPPKMPVSTLS